MHTTHPTSVPPSPLIPVSTLFVFTSLLCSTSVDVPATSTPHSQVRGGGARTLLEPVFGIQSEGETDMSLSVSKDDVEGLDLIYESCNEPQVLQ